MFLKNQGIRHALLQLVWIILSATITHAQPTHPLPMLVVPDKTSGEYDVGDTVRWNIQWISNAPAPTDAAYAIKSGGYKITGQGKLTFRDNNAALETHFDEPNTVLVEIKWGNGDQDHTAVGGAVADLQHIRTTSTPPEDFEAFWKTKIAELEKIPANPKLEITDGGKPGVTYCKITMDNIRGTHIHGQLARPTQTATNKKLPALLIVQYAGVYPLQKSWVTDRAAEGWLALNIEAHDIYIDKPDAYYADLKNGALKDYWTIGNDDRDQSYYLRMYLSCYRAVQYLKQRPDWDGKTLVVMGASQGGQQTIVTAGLCADDITAALAFVPAACDMLAPEAGRASGFPQWYQQTQGGKDPKKVHEASRYYDPVNFARLIRCPMLVAAAFKDDVAPTGSIVAAVNAMTAPVELFKLPRAGHFEEEGSHRAYNTRAYDDWLNALRNGKPAPVRSADGSHWVGTWTTSAQHVEEKLQPAMPPGLADVTIRQIVRVSIGGRQVRVRFSNAFGTGNEPLQISAANIAISSGSSAIKPDTLKPLTFSGKTSARIPAGATIASDPIAFDLAAGSDLAITIHAENAVKEVTGHRGARTTTYVKAGNTLTATDMPEAATTTAWYYLCGVDVFVPQNAAAVICFGDSITDGYGVKPGENHRWPDFLARRLQANPQTAHIAVLNQGIGGNTLWTGGIGQTALARLERDVLTQTGAHGLIVFEGINDLGGGKTTADEIIATYEQIISRARDRGLHIYGATITPCGGSNYLKPEAETARKKINTWIRMSGAFDAVIDFDAALRDPDAPDKLLKAYDSGDHLHPSDEGYRALAEAVNLKLFAK